MGHFASKSKKRTFLSSSATRSIEVNLKSKNRGAKIPKIAKTPKALLKDVKGLNES